MPEQVSRPGLRIEHVPQRVVIESPEEGLCSMCADELPDELFQLLGNQWFDTDSRPSLVRVLVWAEMSVEAVEELADFVEKSIDWCRGGHQGCPDGEL